MKTYRNQRGYLLITVVITLFLIASIALLLASDSSISANTSNRELETARAEYLAQAGLQHALWRTANSACMGDLEIPDTPLGADSYSATVAGAAAGTLYTVSADQDAWIRSDDVTRNNGATATNRIRQESGAVEQVLTRFDVSTIPAGAKINSAIAWFHLKALKPHPEGPINVHEITADWTETAVTWESFAARYRGGRVAMLPAQDAGDVWVAINLTGLVQSWVNGQPNYGILFDAQVEGIHTEYTAREDGGNPPRLEIVVGGGDVSPVSIKASGKLGNGVSLILRDKTAMTYQPPGTVVLQLGDDPGADAMLDSFYPRNYGGRDYVQVNEKTGDWVQRPVFKFDVGSVPAGARIESAQLELRMRTVLTPGVASIHGVSRSWVEGTKSGTGAADGATWATYDGVGTWTSEGGDFNAAAVAETTIAATDTWVSWEIGPLVEQWLAGEPNYGLLLKSDGILEQAEFYSKEETDATLRPKLTIRYACECGTPCMVLRGKGRIALIGDDWTPDPDDQLKVQLFESWGYEVDFYQDRDSGGIDWSNYDLAYVSATVIANDVNANLADLSIGVVNEERRLYNDLELANGSTENVGSSIDITDNSHFITSIFPAGPLSIYTGDMEVTTADLPLADDLQTLAQFSGAATLTALEQGAQTTSGTAAGRRVTLPFGQHSTARFDWTNLNHNGHLLVQRAIAWGIGEGKIDAGKLLLVVGDANNPANNDTDRRDLFESWGYTVTLIDDGTSQADLDAAATANNVIYVSASINGGTLADKLTTSTAAIVNEFSGKLDNFGFSSDTGNTVTTDTFYGSYSDHYIAEPFGDNNITVFTTNRIMPVGSGTLAPDLRSAAAIGTLTWALPTLNVNDQRWDGTPSPGRRVHLPFGDANVSELTDDGNTMMRRSLEWAAGAGPKYGLIAHWKLDEDTGLIAVDSVGGHDGTLENGPTWTAGAIDGGVHFSDESHAISVPHSESLTITGDLTLLAWVNLDELRPNRPIIQKGTSNVNHNYYFGLTDDNMQFAVSPPGGGWHVKGSGATGILPGTWHHLAVSFDDSTDVVKFYLDGVPFAKQELTHSPSEFAGPVRIGRNDLNYGIKSSIDDVRIYRDVLTEAEIAELATRPETLPIAHWKLDETSGTTAVDTIGGRDGTLVNGPTWETGHLDGALDFDGSNDFVNVPHDDNLSLTDAMTLTAWISASSFGPSYQTILAKDDGGAGSNYWFGTWQQLPVFGFFAGGFFREVFNPSFELQPNTWHHLAASFDNATGDTNIYVDGTLVQNGTLNLDPTAVSADLSIGRSPDGERWRGMLDDVRIYDEILSASEIANLASAGSGGGGGGGGGDPGPVLGGFAEVGAPNDATSVNVPIPISTNSGDLLIAALVTDGDSASSFGAPAGWTLVDKGMNSSGKVSLGVWWKIASASEPADVGFTWSGREKAYGWVMRYTGHDAASPILFDNGALNNDRTAGPICQRLITPVDNMLVLRIGGFDDDDINTGLPGLDGHTPVNMGESGGTNGNVSGGSGYMIQSTAGDSGLAYFELTGVEEMRTVTLGIRPE